MSPFPLGACVKRGGFGSAAVGYVARKARRRRVMDDQTYRCDLCGETFEAEDQLREHWEATHESETHQPIGASAH
jgi:hypothetical protein